jgi:hypothetical protein
MKKTIKVRAETLEKAKKKFKEEIPNNVFILKIIDEFGTYKPNYDTGYSIGDTVEEAIAIAKEKLPDPYFIKGEVVPELEANTNIRVPVLIKANSDWQAKYIAEDYIKNRFFPNAGFGVAEHYYLVIDNQMTQKGFKGVFGVGKQEDTYTVTFFIKPKVTLKYSMWSYIVAEITDDNDILNGTMIKCAKKQRLDEVKKLIEQGADINYCDKDGRNALFYICHDFKISKLLIDKGIDFRKNDNNGDNILTYCQRNDCVVHYNIGKFLEKNGIKKDEVLFKRMIREALESERREIEANKRWCPKCNIKVDTVDKNQKYYDDGWMEEVDITCSKCGTLIEHYRGQTRN